MRKFTAALFTALCLLAFASAVSATVNVTLVGPSTFTPGGTVTLQTYVTADGGELDNAVFGAIQYPDALVNPNPAGNSQVSLSTIGTAAPGWLTGALTCTTAFCVAFSQVNPNGVQTAGLTNQLIATTSFIVDPGIPLSTTIISFTWRTSPSTQRLDWFGVTNAPGVTLTVIPEPATAALLGAGLAGFALATRRRARAGAR